MPCQALQIVDSGHYLTSGFMCFCAKQLVLPCHRQVFHTCFSVLYGYVILLLTLHILNVTEQLNDPPSLLALFEEVVVGLVRVINEFLICQYSNILSFQRLF